MSSSPSGSPLMSRSKTKEAKSRPTKTYAQERIDNTAELKQIERVNELKGLYEQGLATRLYYACLQAFKEHCRDAAQATSAHTQQSFPSVGRRSARLLSRIGKGGRFVCHDCDRPFATENDLTAHIYSHGKTRPKGPFHERPQRYPGHTPPTVTSTALSKRVASQIKHIADPQASSAQICTTSIAKDQMAKFFLWGEGFSDGRLDKALDQSDELRNTVLGLLCDVAMELQKKKWLQQSSSYQVYPTEIFKEISLLVDQSRTVIARDALGSVREHEDASTISSISSPKNSSESETPEVGHDLDSILRSLMDLASAIENNLIQAERKDITAKHTNVSAFNVSQHAQIYVSHIRDKFRNAPIRLVERLGEANWQRHVIVRARMDQEGGVPEDKETILAAFNPKSIFHDSGLGTTITASSHYAASIASHNSFLSSVAERERGSLRVPPTPPEISAGKPFICFACGHVQKKLKNRVDWKMHVFSDLKPYICTSSMCSQELVQFPTRKAWAEHEFSEHHQLHAWKCSKCTAEYTDLEQLREHMQTSHTDILSQAHLGVAMELSLDRREKLIIESPCPLCLAPTGSSRREYVKHVGRHMEEIALIVLPKEDGHSDESSDESSNEELVEISSSTSKRHNKAQASQGDAVLIDFLRGSHPDTSSATNSAAHVPRISRRSPSPGQTRSESSSLPTDLVEGDREDLVGVARPAAKGQGINARFSPVPKGYKPLKEWSCGWCHFGPMTINFEMFCANCQRMKDDYATCR